VNVYTFLVAISLRFLLTTTRVVVKIASKAKIIIGMLRKTYLKTQRKALYSQMIITGKLFDHLHEIYTQAKDMLELLMKQII